MHIAQEVFELERMGVSINNAKVSELGHAHSIYVTFLRKTGYYWPLCCSNYRRKTGLFS